MDALRYTTVLSDYVHRFNDRPPSILMEDAALDLMEAALRRGAPISARDLVPDSLTFDRRAA